jgi:hypothetical protein
MAMVALPRRWRESRRLPWRLGAIFEPRLKRRLPRERFPTTLRNSTRRGHYPWLKVYGPERGAVSMAGREGFEPRWRNSYDTWGPSAGRRGRKTPMHRRLALEPAPRWALSVSRT